MEAEKREEAYSSYMLPLLSSKRKPPLPPIHTYSDLILGKAFKYLCFFFILSNIVLAAYWADTKPIKTVLFILLALTFSWLEVLMRRTSVDITSEGVWIDYGMWMRWIPLDNAGSFTALRRSKHAPLGIKTIQDAKTYIIPLVQGRGMSRDEEPIQETLQALNADLRAVRKTPLS